MSIREEDVSFSLEVNVEKAYEESRRLLTLLYRIAGMVQKLTGSPELDALMSKAIRTIAAINRVRLMIALFETSLGPIGWALAAVTAVETALTVGETIQYLGS